VPDDAALAAATRSCAALTPKYWLWRQSLLDAGVEDHEVVDDLQQALLAAELQFS
jgi:hypothetical protein